ncbi:single-stranded DNA-binding protein [Streptomyces sp. NBC_01242]|uniref:single-stranded DNA-binding protein n=1 Tax=Streptomyces sp. NBC_01242 TaxID=2903795 RepID=UPI002253769A|nr:MULTISPECIES: single-stranded DNA-binding protein [unclassified Streptomyces]MCX4797453.1 single-stranded DNA-binding protein [Streptomyces sp. NBC_01242]WSJ38736.1 single-stranded DNA-binding protein [Streptomyces sp. NBC_01321]WSU24162.1 single-stranded DNA-binding protein [Streptomyces sp. NBC_01108]
MNDTLVTLVGNAATGVEFRETATGGMARFRFAVTPRRWDREKQFWTDGHTSFYTVWAWRSLATNLSGSVSIGEPLVVHGRLKVREEEREGLRRTFVDIEAVAVGHDLTRGTAAFRRVTKGDPRSVVRRGSVDGALDRGDGPGRSDEPDWSGGPARETREAQEVSEARSGGSREAARAEGDEREGGGEQSERVEQSEQSEQADRVGRQRVRRPTVRQKRGKELASVS